MKRINKSLSLFMATVFVMAGVLTNVTAKAEVVAPIVPKIDNVLIGHAPLLVGDTEKFTMTTSNYTGKVQYAAFAKINNKWTKLSGYCIGVDSKTPYQLPAQYKYLLGKYNIQIWVRKEGVKGTKSSIFGDYENVYSTAFNTVPRSSAQISVNGNEKVEVAGLKMTFNGIENICGFRGPYVYELNLLNSATGKWSKVAEYATKPVCTFTAAGTYVLVAHVKSVNSTKAYQAWKSFNVTVKNDATPVFNTTVKAATFGSIVKVSMTTEGVKAFATATKYQIFDGTTAISAVTALGTDTTVFPIKALGAKVNVKLLNAAGVEVKTIEVLLGQSGTITVVPPVVVPPVTSVTTATVKAATFGAIVKVTSNLKDAVKYQVFDGTIAISDKLGTTLGTETVVFPGKVVGNKVNVKLMNAAGAVLATSEVTLVAAK